MNECKISTDLYIKSTDSHRYLHLTSSHSNHTKRSIVYSQWLLVKTICSEIFIEAYEGDEVVVN